MVSLVGKYPNIQVKVAEYNFSNDTIRWHMSKSTKDSNTFLHLKFQRYTIFNVLPSKSSSRSQSTILAMTLFDGKCQNVQKTPTHFEGEKKKKINISETVRAGAKMHETMQRLL